jgi:2,3-dihydroxyphenylpropionate 1,2-dioxygenase
MPAFCIGIHARSVGDYGTVAGELPVASEMAQELAASCLKDGIDVAYAHRMEVDHGFAQVVELIFSGAKLPNVIPIFINCAAAPRPTFARARMLGEAIGRWAFARPERVYLIASGGLSHDPPIASLSDVSGAKREALIEGRHPSYAARLARQSNVFSVGQAHVAGTGDIIPINVAWDRSLLESICAGQLDTLDGYAPEELTRIAGCGAHEVRTWVATLSALRATGKYSAETRFYAPIEEWITGTAIVKATVESTP